MIIKKPWVGWLMNYYLHLCSNILNIIHKSKDAYVLDLTHIPYYFYERK